jgi:hypothetical protein
MRYHRKLFKTNDVDFLQTRFKDAEFLENDKHSDQPVKVSFLQIDSVVDD